MPGFDRTGSLGAGPRTGRGMGYCRGSIPAIRPETRFGLGRRGRDRGWRNHFWATCVSQWIALTPEQELADLQAEADLLKAQLDAIQKRMNELKS